MITGSGLIMARMTEVAVLQAKKSSMDGDNGWQTAQDCMDSIIRNGLKIVSPAAAKATTTGISYLVKDVTVFRVNPLGFDAFFNEKLPFKSRLVSYTFRALAWLETLYSCTYDDPIAIANQRGIVLK